MDLSIQKIERIIRIRDNNVSGMNHRLFAERHRCWGLLGMRDWVELVGDSFPLVLGPGQGTTVHTQTPVHNGA
jgi:hypothetical protein